MLSDPVTEYTVVADGDTMMDMLGMLFGCQVNCGAPAAVSVTALDAQTRVEEATAKTGRGVTVIWMAAELVPHPLTPVTT